MPSASSSTDLFPPGASPAYFVAAIAAAAVSTFIGAISFGMGASRPRFRDLAFFAVGATFYCVLDIFLVTAPDVATVPLLSRIQLLGCSVGMPAWLRFARNDAANPNMGVTTLGRAAVVTGIVAQVPHLFWTDKITTVGLRGVAVWEVNYPNILGNLAIVLLTVGLLCGLVMQLQRARAGQPGAAAECIATTVLFLAGTNDALLAARAFNGLFLLPSAYAFALLACSVGAVQSFTRDMKEGALLRIALHRDVAQRTEKLALARATMRQAERLAAIGTLSAGVAHEVNNPLAAISGNLEFLLDEHVAGRLRAADATPLLFESGELLARIGRIVRQLLTAGRASKSAVVSYPVRLADALKSAIDGLPSELRCAGDVLVDVPHDAHVLGDEVHVTQIFANLIANALQAMQGGLDSTRHREVRITAVEPTAPYRKADEIDDADARPLLAIKVADTAGGMPDAVRERIFDPFFTTKPRGRGTGLGLAITHELVTSLGGSIRVTSELGVGTTFYLSLRSCPPPRNERGEAVRLSTSRPTLEAHSESLRAAEQADLRRSTAPRRPRVLVVDDEPSLRQSIERMLATDFEVVGQDGPISALEAVRSGSFDAILCDVVMPNGGGEELYRMLLVEQPFLAGRVVFMTGGAPNEGSRLFLGMQPHKVLEKPFRRREVLDELHRVIRRSISSRGMPKAAGSSNSGVTGGT